MPPEDSRSTLTELRHVVACLKRVRVNLRLLFLAAFLSVILMGLNLYIVSLLFPLADGLIQQDFGVIAKAHGIRELVPYLPAQLVTGTALFCLLAAWLYVCVLIKAGLSYVVALTVRIQAQGASTAIRTLMLERYMGFGKAYFDALSPEKIRSHIARCASWIEQMLVNFHLMVSDLLRLAVYAGVMLYISWKLTLAVAIVAPPIVLLMRRIARRLKNLAREEKESLEEVHAGTVGVMSRMTLVQACEKQLRELQELADRSRSQFAFACRVHRLESLVSPLQEIGMTTAQLIVAWSLALVAPASLMEPADIFVFFFLASRAVPLFNSVSRFHARLLSHSNAYSVFETVMSDAGKFPVTSGERQFTGLREAIRFNHLAFSHDRGDPLFTDLSFEILPGRVTALVGATGAGKTTIAHLLLRLYDCPKGAITIDGVPIHDFDAGSLRRQIAFVDQHPIILDASLRDNICYALDAAPGDEAIARALEQSGLTAMVQGLPEGLDTVLGDQGARISGGEKQRIAICRALLKNAPILILDEATSALDPQTENEVMQAVMEASKGKTVLIISHRLTTVRHADWVLMLEAGSIAESGSFAELSANGSAFARRFASVAVAR